ncbi:MAG TPA: nucleotidyl transferase AbiEii/AbiGii toxin family protein [Candidatus Aquicultor sp.]|jgi:predicted nucleotidyltransferase
MPAWHIFMEAAKTLDDAGIDFVLCGGIAVRLYGRVRETTDVDFLISEEDVDQALEFLGEAGFKIKRTDPRWLFQAFKDTSKVDLIFEAMGAVRLSEEVREHAKPAEIEGYTYRVIAPEDLLIMKAHSLSEERPRDLFDAFSIIKETDGKLDWHYFLDRSRPRAQRMLGLLLFAKSEHEISAFVPGWVIQRLVSYLPT